MLDKDDVKVLFKAEKAVSFLCCFHEGSTSYKLYDDVRVGLRLILYEMIIVHKTFDNDISELMEAT